MHANCEPHRSVKGVRWIMVSVELHALARSAAADGLRTRTRTHVRMYASRITQERHCRRGGRPGKVPNAMASAECRVLAAQTAIGTGRAPPTIAPAACNCRRRVLCHPLVDGEGHGGAGTIVAKKDEVCAPRSLQQRRRARAVAGRNARACGAGAAREKRAQRGLGGQTRAGTA
jgi:hypothetical protein